MSSEVAKKRGRPKKAICDAVEVQIPETIKKSTTRAKSTKSTPKAAVKPKTTTVAPKTTSIDTHVSKPAVSSRPIAKAASKSPPPATPASLKTESKSTAPTPSRTTSASPVTPETSNILSKVSELSAKNTLPPEDSSKSWKPSPPTASNKSPPPPPQTAALPKKPFQSNTTPTSAKSNPMKSSQAPPSSPKPPSKFPIAALNSEIVSNISSRAGAKPITSGSRALPTNYKPIARKVTMAIVAMPIAIVTSWVLYERLVLGEDRKLLVKPGLTMVETPGGEEAKFDERSGGSSPSL